MNTKYTEYPKVHVLLPVYNRKEVTLRFVKSLKKQAYQNYHLILIDDGSTDATAEAVREHLSDATIIRGTGNWWWAGSLQQGYNWLIKERIPMEDYVLIMNDDTEFNDDFLETGLAVIQEAPNSMLTAKGYNLKTGLPQDPGGYVFNWHDLTCLEANGNTEINCLSTRGMLTKVRDFLRVGGFYPKLIPHYLSDLEFTMRAKKKGIKLLTDNSFRVYVDFDTTGYHSIEDKSFLSFTKKLFSKRSARNPIAWIYFIILRCPWNQKLQTLTRYVLQEFKHLLMPRFIIVVKKYVSGAVRSMVRLLPENIIQFLKKVIPDFLQQKIRKYHDYPGL